MQTNLAEFLRHTPDGDEAEAILRKCVHCGFCTATCPTYQLLGDELDGPRGRIYLIKQMVEGQPVTRETQRHLDRCLTCRSCESTCPSGVQYGRLAEIGRRHVDAKVGRPAGERALRWTLAHVLPNRALFSPALRLGQQFRTLLPRSLREKVPHRQRSGSWPQGKHARRMLMLEGCVQPAMLPNVNKATARVLDALGIEMVRPSSAGCCGAIRLHLNYHDDGLDDARRNIDAWWPEIEAGAEAIVINASGCGATIKEYGHLLRHDAQYAGKAQRVSELARDLSEVMLDNVEALQRRMPNRKTGKIAYHPPCTLQHGQQLKGVVEKLLAQVGVNVMLPQDSHICCGSAGTYSVTQPVLSHQLRDAKWKSLDALDPELVVSANVGCICHLQATAKGEHSRDHAPVQHWIELIDRMMTPAQ
ncbi:glycolate oxidase iron-sulfur subunit [Pandoraea iniqua]|uniref:Glycolate oxidase iron-sulfur subunit n=1 Tax=Pandoraea iniqua TaxID=2508288 RepID=A0A5E4ZF68_9BURK|nr:glycolate oxidase subunit GlcF [Pandoraea iniqua]VVE55492.1 glycolate oxidase iron-sulfur subunit [Pandoraea iniqua]VVE58930.1 glycolate oxidase iron-sulfur subunit [Pandoraea iniqua]